MAYEQDDGGAVQEMSAFDVEATAKNFRESSDEFAQKSKNISEVQKNNSPRRVSLTSTNGTEKTALTIVDHNEFVKNLETNRRLLLLPAHSIILEKIETYITKQTSTNKRSLL